MQTLSVAVVGTGPAGATAARLLASKGARVTLLDARRLPRTKLCGGGLTPKAQRLVPPNALETVDRRVHRVELRGGRFPAVHLDVSEAEIAMVERGRFDFALTQAAAAAGAEVRDAERVPQAWVLSFSYSRAIQDPVLEVWRGRAANAPAAQDAFAHRARLNDFARMGSVPAGGDS